MGLGRGHHPPSAGGHQPVLRGRPLPHGRALRLGSGPVRDPGGTLFPEEIQTALGVLSYPPPALAARLVLLQDQRLLHQLRHDGGLLRGGPVRGKIREVQEHHLHLEGRPAGPGGRGGLLRPQHPAEAPLLFRFSVLRHYAGVSGSHRPLRHHPLRSRGHLSPGFRQDQAGETKRYMQRKKPLRGAFCLSCGQITARRLPRNPPPGERPFPGSWRPRSGTGTG